MSSKFRIYFSISSNFQIIRPFSGKEAVLHYDPKKWSEVKWTPLAVSKSAGHRGKVFATKLLVITSTGLVLKIL